MREKKILLVEGRSASSSAYSLALKKEEFRVHVAHTGNEAMLLIKKITPDLVVYDAVSMRSSGVRTCKRLRNTLGETPIIHCRADKQAEDRSVGADVYLVKPFTPRKLLNRIKALIPADDLKEEIVRAGSLTFFLSKRSVELRGRGERSLTPKLASLLEEFLRHPNEVLGRDQLMRSVWDTSYLGDTRTLDVHIRWMREIIEDDPARPKILKTVRSMGYIFSIPPSKR
jgi:DNA-binding response OmpR family regulator